MRPGARLRMSSAAAPPTTTVKSRRFSFRRRNSTSTNLPNSPPNQSPKSQKAVTSISAGNGNGGGNGVEDCSRWVPSRGELEKVFKKFDANNDGKISASELRGVMGSMGGKSSDEEVSLMMKEADSDGDGFISFEEFYEANTKGVNAKRAMKDLESAFKMYDLDKSGQISVEELFKVLQSLGEKSSVVECREMVKRVDKNADGFISFDEFVTMMSTPHPNQS